MRRGKLYIYDEISPWGITAADFVDKLNTLKDEGYKSFILYIDSPGGNVFDAIAIYNEVKALDDCTVFINGWAASAASLVAMAGTKVKIVNNSYIMIHNPWTWAAGDSNYLKKVQEQLVDIQKTIVDIYTDKTGQDEKSIQDWMDEDTWMKADLAKERGFADKVVPPGKMAKFSGFLNFYNKETDKPKGADMNKIKLMLINLFTLALTIEDSETSIVDQIKEVWDKAQKSIKDLTSDLGTANEKILDLETKLENAETQLSSGVDENVKAVLENAIGRGVITDAEKSIWNKQLREDFESTKAILEGKKPVLSSQVDPPDPKADNRGDTAEMADIIRNQMQGKVG